MDRVAEVAVDPFDRLADKDRGNDRLRLEPGVEGVLHR